MADFCPKCGSSHLRQTDLFLVECLFCGATFDPEADFDDEGPCEPSEGFADDLEDDIPF